MSLNVEDDFRAEPQAGEDFAGRYSLLTETTLPKTLRDLLPQIVKSRSTEKHSRASRWPNVFAQTTAQIIARDCVSWPYEIGCLLSQGQTSNPKH